MPARNTIRQRLTMNTLYNDLEKTVQRYVLGKLSESEAIEFEEYYLSNPDIIEMVETAQNMNLGLAHEPAAMHAEIANSQNSFLQKLFGWLSVPIPAYAVLAAAAVFTPLAVNNLGFDKPSEQIALANFSTATTRGIKQTGINLAGAAGTFALMIKLKQIDYPYYKLKIYRPAEAKPVWVSNQFQVSALRDQLIVIPDQAKINNATVEVVGVDSEFNEAVVEFCHYSEVCR